MSLFGDITVKPPIPMRTEGFTINDDNFELIDSSRLEFTGMDLVVCDRGPSTSIEIMRLRPDRCDYCRNQFIPDKRGACSSCGAPMPEGPRLILGSS